MTLSSASTTKYYESSLSSVRAPRTFSGNMEDWPFYKKKMESYLARLDLIEVMTEGEKVIQDDHKFE